jgi:hypothetical protein
VVAVPAWADFMKQATGGDGPDWFTPPADVQKVTICRLTGQLATEACRHGWTGPDYVQAGLTEIPGEAVGTTGRRPAPTPSKSMVYDDYFPMGSAPTEPCALHNSGDIVGSSGNGGETAMATSFASPSPSRIQTVIAPAGGAVWVVR